MPRLDEDSRLIPVLENLSQGFVAGISTEWTNATGPGSASEIKAEMVDDLARKHFPMCMRSLHENLRRDHHLKHFGRLQYGLFLKARRPIRKILAKLIMKLIVCRFLACLLKRPLHSGENLSVN